MIIAFILLHKSRWLPAAARHDIIHTIWHPNPPTGSLTPAPLTKETSVQLSNFFVRGLHGSRSLRVRLTDNTLVLVGENGSGKTTLINMLYFFLSTQWSKLLRYNFDSIGAVINDTEIQVTRDQVESSLRGLHARYMPRSRYLKLRHNLLTVGASTVLDDRAALSDLAHRYGVPLRVVLDVATEMVDAQLDLGFSIEKVTEDVRGLVNVQLLYLPTYRRIEHDLKAIMPEIELENVQALEQKRGRSAPDEHIELVHFGMEDVEKSISRKMSTLKESLRTGLNNLTGTYLREVIGGQYQAVDADSLRAIKLDTIDSFLSRIEEKVLPEDAKKSLRLLVDRVQDEQVLPADQKVVAHFLLRLFELYKQLEEEEKGVRRFAKVCNSYLVGKRVVYDNANFEIRIQLTHDAAEPAADDAEVLTLKTLSSGEKQIVSLFSHLMLSEKRSSFVLIDEPELSLSVTWQHQFLPDIQNTGRCAGLIAVTHSPFVFENNLDPYAHALSEFIV